MCNRLHQHLCARYKSQTLPAIPLSGHRKILHTLIGMGSAALAAAVPYQVMRPEFPAKDKEVLKTNHNTNYITREDISLLPPPPSTHTHTHTQYFSPSYIHTPQLSSTRHPHISVNKMYGWTRRVLFVSPTESLAHPEKIFQRCLFPPAKPTLSSRKKKKKKKKKNSHQSFKVGQETGSGESESTGRLHTEMIDVVLVRGGVVVEVVFWWRWYCGGGGIVYAALLRPRLLSVDRCRTNRFVGNGD